MKKKKDFRPRVNICPQCGNVVPIGDHRYKVFYCKRCRYEIQPDEVLLKEYRDEVES